jgi:hypothetical protein
LGYIPFFALKRFGWKSLQSKKFTPYYEAIKQVRRQIDIGVIIQRLIYMDRVTKSILDDNQRRLMHAYPKENIYQLKEHRSGIKTRDKIKDAIANKEMIQILSSILPDMIGGGESQTPTGLEELRTAYENLKRRHDKISRHILKNIDP